MRVSTGAAEDRYRNLRCAAYRIFVFKSMYHQNSNRSISCSRRRAELGDPVLPFVPAGIDGIVVDDGWFGRRAGRVRDWRP